MPFCKGGEEVRKDVKNSVFPIRNVEASGLWRH